MIWEQIVNENQKIACVSNRNSIQSYQSKENKPDWKETLQAPHKSYPAQRAKYNICASKSYPILRNLIMDKPFAATCTEINVAQSTSGQWK